ncbi:hypothetical protein AALB64_15535 [Lachnospiraceae bacterium 45-P1]
MKYNLSKIMKRAWELVKEFGMTISSGLKKAWKEARSMKEQLIAKMELLTSLANKAYDYKISVSDWENYGKSRTYFKIYETRKNSRHNVIYDCGYYDNQKDVYVPGKKDLTKNYTLSGAVIG